MSRFGIVLLIAALATLPLFHAAVTGLAIAGLLVGFLIAFADFHRDADVGAIGENDRRADLKGFANYMFGLALVLGALAYEISDKSGPLIGASMSIGAGLAAILTALSARRKVAS